jgi:mono/diheme cytochrome c family protein
VPPARIYADYCLACHEANGKGEKLRPAMRAANEPPIPDFTDAQWQKSRSDADLQRSILEGKGKFMLPMKDKLSPEDARALVALVRGYRQGKAPPIEPPKAYVPPPPEVPKVVEKPKAVPGPERRPVQPVPETPAAETAGRLRVATGLFRQYCLTCHGPDGRGADMRPGMPTIPDFTAHRWQEGVTDPQLVASILDGKGTFMPAFRDRVSAERARDLAAYIRALGPARPRAKEEGAAPSDFEKRFRELEAQWQELQSQLEELSKGRRKP